MKKQIIIEIENYGKFENGDMLIFENDCFRTISKSALFKDTFNYLGDYGKKICVLERKINQLEKQLKFDRGEITQEELNDGMVE